MALMKRIPVLVLSETGVSEGVFDPTVNDPMIFRSKFDECIQTENKVIDLWLGAVNTQK